MRLMGQSREGRCGNRTSSPQVTGEHEFSELLGSDVRSLISGVSVGARDWRHASECCAAAREPARWGEFNAREANE
jgi:hypothetical protein